MRAIACQAPTGAIEPAPLTSFTLADQVVADAELSAFWAADDRYYLRADGVDGASHWYRLESGLAGGADSDLATVASALRADAHVVGHLGPRDGGVSFPFGSTGRTVFRVWRAKGAEKRGRTRILAVRAARSRRLPA